MRKFVVTILFLLAAASTGFSQSRFVTYNNDRFHFSVQYPSDLLKMQAPPENNDGRTFLSKDKTVEMRAWGQFNALDLTLDEAYQRALRDHSGVTYKTLGDRNFVISGVSDGKIYYQKTLIRGSGDTAVFYTFTIEYPKSKKAKFDPVVTRVSRSFKFDPHADI